MFMRTVLFIFTVLGLLWGCTPEFIPDTSEAEEQQTSIITPTNNPNDRSGTVQASFLSSESNFTFANSIMDSVPFTVSYVSTAQNMDSVVWIFEGSTLDNDTLRGRLMSNSPTESIIAARVQYNRFGRYNVTHAVANQDNFDILTERNYVTYEFLDSLQIQTADTPNGWASPQQGWFSPSMLYTYSVCENALVGFHTVDNAYANDPHVISKDFRSFGTSPKNLVFEYKLDYLALPASEDENTKFSLSYNAIFAATATETIVPSELWAETGYDADNWKQVVIELPLIGDFRLTFTKFPSIMDSQNRQLFPFSVCVRNIRIIPSD